MTGSINAYDGCAGAESKNDEARPTGELRWFALTVEALALAELELLTSAGLTVFLTLNLTGITSKKTSFFKLSSILFANCNKCTSNSNSLTLPTRKLMWVSV